MSPPRVVVVIGCGVAGTAAAWSASRNGASVVLLGEVDGAARFLSGALDVETWETDASSAQAVDPHVSEFVDALGIWRVGAQPACVASPWGILRAARGHDRAVLDISSLRAARVAVLRVDRPDWNADLLANAWRDDRWSKDRELRFDPLSVDFLQHDHERFLSDQELAATLDDDARRVRVAQRLRDRLAGFDAVLAGPWLGIDTDAAGIISRELRRPIGETLSLLASSAGWRFVRARDRLMSSAGVTVRKHAVSELSVTDSNVMVRCAGADDITADTVVIASGGLAGGGFSYDPFEADPAAEIPGSPRAPFAASFRSPAVVAFEGRPTLVFGSMYGTDLERFAWPALPQQAWPLDTVSFLHRGQVCLDVEGRALRRLLVAGKAASSRPTGALGAAASGLAAGRAAAAGPAPR